MQPDPIGFMGGMNFYVYVGNNTVNFVDPWGWENQKYASINPFWIPTGKLKIVKWDWKHHATNPISIGGWTKEYWINEGHFRQRGRWLWSRKEIYREWRKSGEKITSNYGYIFPYGPGSRTEKYMKKPSKCPEP